MLEKIPVEVSARHVHLTKEAFYILFGKEAVLEIKKELSQPGQFLSTAKVSVVGPKDKFSSVSVLGPFRDYIQVELSKTDLRKIGIDAPIRESGNIEGSGACKIIGPKGEIEIKKGVIAAKRHIHANFEQAKALNVKDGDVVFLRIDSKERSLIFGDVVVRVSGSYSLVFHIDTDECNACNFSCETAKIINI